MTHFNKMSLTAKIYSKKCPDCHKDNLENSAFCWNCNYEFPDQMVHKVNVSGNWWGSFFVTLIFIGAVIVLVLIIIDAVR